jgi:hypothetical protein
MKVHHQKKSYPGRWLVKTVEVMLVAGLVFFGLTALMSVFVPVTPEQGTVRTLEYRMVDDNPRTFEVGSSQTQANVPQVTYDAVDYFRMGLAHQMRDDYYEAITDYTRAIEIDSSIAASYLNRGVAYESMNNMASAAQDYKEWITREGINPTYIREALVDGDTSRVNMSEGSVFIYRFQAEPGQRLTVSAESVVEGLTDPIVVVLDAYGNPVAADDDIRRASGELVSMDSLIDGAQLSHRGGCMDGSYMLLVSHAGGGSTGAVDITLDLE